MEFEVGLAGWWHLFFFGLLLPYAAIRSKRRFAERPLPTRRKFYLSAIAQQVVFAGTSIFIARREWIPLVPDALPPWWIAPLAALVLVALLAIARPIWRAAVARGERRTELLMPADATERVLWVTTSVFAGIGEEMTYRGVLYALLWRLSDSVPLAVLGSAVVFGVSHWMQGWRPMLMITVFALLMQGLAMLTGSLIICMAIHAAYDITAGFTYARFGRARNGERAAAAA